MSLLPDPSAAAGLAYGVGPHAAPREGSQADRHTGLDLVLAHRLVERMVDVVVRVGPGDRPLVGPGEAVGPGTPLLERLRDGRIELVTAQPAAALHPGDRWPLEAGHASLGEEEPGILGAIGAQAEVERKSREDARRREARRRHFFGRDPKTPAGELLFETRGRWRLATGGQMTVVTSTVAGIVRKVQPGVAITIHAMGHGLRGSHALGGMTRGQLAVASGPDGELRPGGVDVGFAGAILVVGSRVAAETLTRARAMGVRGIIVGGLAGKDRRDFAASEARQRAALHRLPPFGVLVLDGTMRRAIASPIMDIFHALVGREVAIVDDPPSLVFDHPDVPLPHPPADLVRVRSGALAGREGRWVGLAGRRRFDRGAHLEAGFVRFGGEPPIAVPLADLERWV